MKTAMLHLGEDVHPSHGGFANAINADLVSCSSPNTSPQSIESFAEEFKRGIEIRGFDVLIAEGARPLYAALINKIFYGTRIVYLCAEHRIYQLLQGDTDLQTLYGKFKHFLGKRGQPALRSVLSQGIDAVICVSHFMKEAVQEVVGTKTPIDIAHPYIQQDLYEKLGKANFSPQSKTVTTIGRSAQYKGVDLLVDAWDTVSAQHPEAELHIIGNGHPQEYEITPGVKVHGFVENIVDVYADTGLYVQPARYDAFPVTVLEALRAARPTLVTDKTGTKSAVNQVDPALITSVRSDKIAEKINWYLRLDQDKKNQLSCDAGKIGSQFDPDSRKDAFREAFNNVIKQCS
jgi:glycosyltransferase involved in cell wall biosynthesis